MREKILDILLDNIGVYVSGEEISRMLNKSRTAVWKSIKSLRNEGYLIEAYPRKGYRAVKNPDLLVPREIKRYLNTQRFGKVIDYHDIIDSTNRKAKEFGLQGYPEGTIVVAEEQNRGRGRLDHQWASPRGGIWFSLVLRPYLTPERAPLLTLLAAVSMIKGIEEVARVPVGIKWPNDIFLKGKKLAGILTEINAEMELINFVVVGIGINVNVHKDCFAGDIAEIAASVVEEKGEEVPRPEILGAILNHMEVLFDKAQKEGFSSVIEEWKNYDTTLGEKVEIHTTTGIISGRALDISEDGSLIMEKKKGENIKVRSGDLYLQSN